MEAKKKTVKELEKRLQLSKKITKAINSLVHEKNTLEQMHDLNSLGNVLEYSLREIEEQQYIVDSIGSIVDKYTAEFNAL